MNGAQQTRTPQPTYEETRDRVTVAVGEAGQASGALKWAAAEAARLDVPLQIVAAVPVTPNPTPFRAPSPLSAAQDLASRRREMQTLVDLLARKVQVLPLAIESGPTGQVVLEHVDSSTRVLVLGHRTTGAAQRVATGSVSIAVSGRSPVPVAVVPDGWEPQAHATEPVVVGVDLRQGSTAVETDHEVLESAFVRAAELRVSLHAVHAWTVPALLDWSAEDVEMYRHSSQAAFELFLQPWRERFPDVDVVAAAVVGRPIDALTDAADRTQLVVIGRHTPATRHGGFRLGSTARKVMHHQQVPTLVVPGPAPDRHGGEAVDLGTWAPMF